MQQSPPSLTFTHVSLILKKVSRSIYALCRIRRLNLPISRKIIKTEAYSRTFSVVLYFYYFFCFTWYQRRAEEETGGKIKGDNNTS